MVCRALAKWGGGMQKDNARYIVCGPMDLIGFLILTWIIRHHYDLTQETRTNPPPGKQAKPGTHE